MEIVKCNTEDISLLAELNKELYEDEKNDKIPTTTVLEDGLKNAMNNGSSAYFFKEDKKIVGYALVKIESFPNYLSHFFICRDERRNHLGTTAFNKLLETLNISSIDLDVFVWNSRGQEFWKSLGFEERCIIMRKTD